MISIMSRLNLPALLAISIITTVQFKPTSILPRIPVLTIIRTSPTVTDLTSYTTLI